MNKEHICAYKEFRAELDRICVPEILEHVNTVEIMHDDTVCGILCYAETGHIDCVYIYPGYRRKGFAKKAVLDWYFGNKDRFDKITLEIIHKNIAAKKFWNRLFLLKLVSCNPIDGRYEVMGVREDALGGFAQ